MIRNAIGILFGLCSFAAALAATPDGYFDPTWAGGGRISFNGDLPNSGASTSVQQVVAESNGNLLHLGFSRGGSNGNHWWLGDLDVNGNFVTSFGLADGTGRITSCQLGLPCTNDLPDADIQVIAQPDGKYLVLTENFVARTLPQAVALDTMGVTGGAGYVGNTFKVSSIEGRVTAYAGMALQPDGKVLLGGAGLDTPGLGIVRLNADLSLDRSFNGYSDGSGATFVGGAIIQSISGFTVGIPSAVLVQSDGGIVIVGAGANMGDGDVLIAVRLLPNGALDTTYGTNGGAIIGWPLGSMGAAIQAMLDPAGRIVVTQSSGTLSAFPLSGLLLERLNTDGSLDTSFAGGFAFDSDSSNCIGMATWASAFDSAGRIISVGECAVTDSDDAFFVARLRGDTGAIDTSFGVSGYGLGHFVSGNLIDLAYSVALDQGGRPIVVGQTSATNFSDSQVSAGVSRLTYDLIFTNDFEASARGCLPPDCD